MIGHRIDSGNNEASELHCTLIEVITILRVHIHTILVGGTDTYKSDMNI